MTMFILLMADAVGGYLIVDIITANFSYTTLAQVFVP